MAAHTSNVFCLSDQFLLSGGVVHGVEPWSVTVMRPLYVSVAVVLCRRVLTRNRLRVRAEKNTLSMLWDKVRECAYHASLGSERRVAECWQSEWALGNLLTG